MLTTVVDQKLAVPKPLQKQYVVLVDPMDPTAMNIAYDLWSGLPGTPRVVPRGAVFMSSLKPLHVAMFAPIAVDDSRPVKSVIVGAPPMPEVDVDEQGNRTVLPPPKDLLVISSASQALTFITEERTELNKAVRAEELKELYRRWVVGGCIAAALITLVVAYVLS